MAVFDDLPPELEREIFIVAARQDRWSAPAIILLCKRTQTWVEPVLYESIILSNSSRVSRFRTCLERRPAAFFAKHVKRLCLSRNVPVIEASHIISICSSVVDLACWFVGYRHAYLSSKIITLPIRHLSVDFDTYLGIACQLHTDYETDPDPESAASIELWNAANAITQLTLLNFIPTREHPTISHLRCFPNLTHLRLTFLAERKYYDAVAAVVKENTSLIRVVLMHVGVPPVDLEGFVQEYCVDGSKCRVVQQDPNLMQEWEHSWDAVIDP